jgi:PPOX class probable F420-dependent enzyme
MALAMSTSEREAFLAEPHIAVVTVAGEDGRAPLAVPMWYGYEPGGDLILITSRESRKARLIRRSGRVSLCAQRTDPPRKYVTVEGATVEIRESVTTEERRALAHRYLGPQGGDAYVLSTAEQTSKMILIRIRPEHWLSHDKSKS